jgi:hypothetical protein
MFSLDKPQRPVVEFTVGADVPGNAGETALRVRRIARPVRLLTLLAVPIKRAAFCREQFWAGDMVRPCKGIARNLAVARSISDAILWHVAWWGDRGPHGLIKGRRPNAVKGEGRQREGNRVKKSVTME